ncbi:glycosyltransferase [Photobacterium damselae]|uniref:glycosyltransferase n=1 Tax=Photobacterium damselae TaxID=38293 RepID=UPI0015A03867|nr:glycosyltransferase [Photobacterium damselae]NVO60948.1 glycosyltransferase [Photobacterium damselae subsp. damselae]
MSKITLYFCQSLPEDIPYCRISKSLLERAIYNGDSVTYVTYKKNEEKQKKEYPNIKLSFFPNVFKNKLLSYICFSIFSFFHALFFIDGIVIIPSTPPVLLVFFLSLVKRIKKNKIELIYHVQDVHPEAMLYSKNKINRLLFDLLIALDTFSIKAVDKVIVLSNDMKKVLSKRVDRKKIYICNNPIHSTLAKSTNHDFFKEYDGYIKFIFSGNVGNFQNLLPLVKAFNAVEDINVKFFILGDGDDMPTIREYLNDNNNGNIILLGKVSSQEADRIVSLADVGVVSLSPGMLGVAFPSKVLAYMSLGLPILGFFDDCSELSKFLYMHNVGCSQGSEDESVLISTINNMVNNINKYDSDNIKELAKRNFNERLVSTEFYKIIHE